MKFTFDTENAKVEKTNFFYISVPILLDEEPDSIWWNDLALLFNAIPSLIIISNDSFQKRLVLTISINDHKTWDQIAMDRQKKLLEDMTYQINLHLSNRKAKARETELTIQRLEESLQRIKRLKG